MNALEQLVRTPAAAVEFAHILLTTEDATIGATPKDEVWTHRKSTLWRYRSTQRRHPVPVLLVFALINRPDIFDLRPGHSFVEFLLEQGFDVFLLDWGVPDDEDADLGLEYYVCDEVPAGIREVLRESGADEVSYVGWCIGGTLGTMHCGLEPDTPVRNLALLTTPIDTTGSRYSNWIARDSFDADLVAESYGAIPGNLVDWANKMLKPVTNFYTTYRQLWDGVLEGTAKREAYQTMARWVADNPPFPAAAYREWITWMYKENRLVRARLRLRGRPVDMRNIEQNLLVITAGADHIAPRENSIPVLSAVSSEDVTHFDRPGGHIGLMAGSKARNGIWPDIADWLAARSDE